MSFSNQYTHTAYHEFGYAKFVYSEEDLGITSCLVSVFLAVLVSPISLYT